MTAIENDIEELEGPFEQIAGTSASGSSSGSLTPTTVELTIDKTSLEYGKINLGAMTQLPVLTEKIDKFKSLQEQLTALQSQGINPSNYQQVTDLLQQVSNLQNEIKGISTELTEASGQQTPDPLHLTVTCNKSQKTFKITVTSTNVRARPGNPTDSLGTLSTDSGTVDPDGTKKVTFVPNGNYGTAAFTVTIDGIPSATVALQITGESKEAAQARLDAEVKKMQDIATKLELGIAALAAVLAAILALSANPVTLIIAVIVVLAALYFLYRIEEDLTKGIKKMKERSAPFISNLPPKAP